MLKIVAAIKTDQVTSNPWLNPWHKNRPLSSLEIVLFHFKLSNYLCTSKEKCSPIKGPWASLKVLVGECSSHIILTEEWYTPSIWACSFRRDACGRVREHEDTCLAIHISQINGVTDVADRSPTHPGIWQGKRKNLVVYLPSYFVRCHQFQWSRPIQAAASHHPGKAGKVSPCIGIMQQQCQMCTRCASLLIPVQVKITLPIAWDRDLKYSLSPSVCSIHLLSLCSDCFRKWICMNQIFLVLILASFPLETQSMASIKAKSWLGI